MKGLQMKISGNWGHFKKPETNNNPLTHDLIPKTALIGMIGAVLGIERREMKAKFPILSENLLYSVALLKPLKKVSWGFSSRTAINPTSSGSPKYFEFLQHPSFKVNLALKNIDSEKDFDSFLLALKNGESIYPPVMGWHNCPADLELISEGTFSELKNGQFTTTSFVESAIVKILSLGKSTRIGFDKLPTHQDDNFWNDPKGYRNIIYPNYPKSIELEGDYFSFTGTSNTIEQCWLM